MRRSFMARICLLSVLALSAASSCAVCSTGVAGTRGGRAGRRQAVSSEADLGRCAMAVDIRNIDRRARKVLPAADLCWWGTWAAPSQDTQVLLVDGSLVMADLVALDKERLVIDSNAGGTIKLPLEVVAGIVFHPSADAQRGDKLRASLLGGSRPSDKATNRNPAESPQILQTDRLILANGDDLAGEITGWNEDSLGVKTAAGEIHVRTDKVAAAAFNPALAARPRPAEARAWVWFSRRLAAARRRDGVRRDKNSSHTGDGHRENAACVTVEAADIVALQPLGGRTAYLSDLKPAGYQQIPFLSLSWPYHADRNVLGTMLRASGRLYLKGLGMHSAARLTYDVPAGYRTLAAEVAIDEQTAGHGSAVVRVYTDDGSGHPQLKYDGPIIRGGAAPLADLGRSGGREASEPARGFRRPRRRRSPRRLAQRPAVEVTVKQHS